MNSLDKHINALIQSVADKHEMEITISKIEDLKTINKKQLMDAMNIIVPNDPNKIATFTQDLPYT